jgi:hypothetical protein
VPCTIAQPDMKTAASRNRSPETVIGRSRSVEYRIATGVPAHNTTVSSVRKTACALSG